MIRPERPVNGDVLLRDVKEEDLPIFFKQEIDPEANRMADVPVKDWEAFIAHWREKVFADETVIARTILFNGQVAGNLECWEQSGEREIGYWIGREFWGKGIATEALSEFLCVMKTRPLYAQVAGHNAASLRVLQKCGFTRSGESCRQSSSPGENLADIKLVLGADCMGATDHNLKTE